MKTPGPDHPITISPNPARVRARFEGGVIADSAAALSLKEADYPAVPYFPRADVETGYFSKSQKVTHCPYKGDATHYAVRLNGHLVEDAAWSYEAPFPAMEEIRGLIAFYPNKIEVYEVSQADLDERRRTVEAD